jgi:hypothetical protein
MVGHKGAKVAKVTSEVAEAARLVAGGTPAVLVGADAAALGEAVRASPDEADNKRLLGVMVGGSSEPAVMAAAGEMAAELWPWAGPPAEAPAAEAPAAEAPAARAPAAEAPAAEAPAAEAAGANPAA